MNIGNGTCIHPEQRGEHIAAWKTKKEGKKTNKQNKSNKIFAF